jgi:hypothetical protein
MNPPYSTEVATSQIHGSRTRCIDPADQPWAERGGRSAARGLARTSRRPGGAPPLAPPLRPPAPPAARPPPPVVGRGHTSLLSVFGQWPLSTVENTCTSSSPSSDRLATSSAVSPASSSGEQPSSASIDRVPSVSSISRRAAATASRSAGSPCSTSAFFVRRRPVATTSTRLAEANCRGRWRSSVFRQSQSKAEVSRSALPCSWPLCSAKTNAHA